MQVFARLVESQSQSGRSESTPVSVDIPNGGHVIAMVSLGAFGTFDNNGWVQGFISNVRDTSGNSFTPSDGNVAMFEGRGITRVEAKLRMDRAWGWLTLMVYVLDV